MKIPALFTAARLGSLLLLSVAPALALTFTSTRTDIGPDFVHWGDSGAEFSYLANGFAATSVGGVGLTVSGSSSMFGFVRLDQGSGVPGNFASGDTLLYTDWQPATVDILFATPVRGAGAQIQSELYGPFSATLEVFNSSGTSLGTTMVAGSSTAAGDNSAVFLGAYSGSAEIKRIVFSIDDGEGILGFAINDLQVRGAPTGTGVPDGRPYTEIVLVALMGFAALRRRGRVST